MRSTPSLGAVDGGAGAAEEDDGVVPVLLAAVPALPLPSLELHAASASAASVIAAMSDKKRRIQLYLQ
jgi:hypothetical protein